MRKLRNGMEVDKKLLKIYIARFLLQIVATLSVAVWVIYLANCLVAYWLGFTFFMSTSYGFSAVASTFMILMWVAWPLFLITALIIAGALIYFLSTKKKYPKEERKLYLIYLSKPFGITIGGLVLAVAVVFAGEYFLDGTYEGAKLMSAFLPHQVISGARVPEEIQDMESVNVIFKNGEMIYLKDYWEKTDELDFLNDVYYIDYISSVNFLDVEMVGADEYEFFDEDGIYVFSVMKKGDYLLMDSSLQTIKENASLYNRYYRLVKKR